MGFRLNTSCAVLPGRGLEGTFGWVLRMLLKARLDLGMSDPPSIDEEGVNAYLGGLLVSYIDPQQLAAIAMDVAPRDTDLHLAIDQAMPDKARMYRIYKVNADDLLISLGIFHRFAPERRAQLPRIKQYYGCACEIQKRIYGKWTALAQIQAKLSEGTQRYLALLSQTRKDYLHFVEQISDENLAQLT